MATYKVGFNPNTKEVRILGNSAAIPGGFTNWGTFNYSDDNLLDNIYPVNQSHVLYHRIRTIAYKNGQLNMQILNLKLDASTGSGNVSSFGPSTGSFTSGANSGTNILTFSGLNAGETISSVSPNDGRVAIAGGGTTLVVGLTNSSTGTVNYTFTSSAGRTATIAITANSGTTTLNVPTNFNSRYATPYTYTRTSSGVYASTFNNSNLGFTPTVTYYVDPVNGNDGNSGLTTGLPLKNVGTALGKSDVDYVDIINMTADLVARSTAGYGGTGTTRKVGVRNTTPQFRFISAGASGTLQTWSQNGTYSNVYQATQTNAGGVIDCSLKCWPFRMSGGGSGYAVNDVITLNNGAVLQVTQVKTAADNFPDAIGAIRSWKETLQGSSLQTSLTFTGGSGTGATFVSNVDAPAMFAVAVKVADIATCGATRNSWYVDGSNVVYWHPLDNRAITPSAPMVVVSSTATNASAAPSGTGGVYCKDIDFVGGQGGFSYNIAGNATNPNFQWDHCSFQGANLNGTQLQGKFLAQYYRCGAYHNFMDGFNIHSHATNTADPTASPFAHYKECVGMGNGTTGAGTTDTSSNDFTGHEYCAAVLENCMASGSDDRTVIYVNDSRVWVLGGFIGSSKDNVTNPSGFGLLDTAQAWLDGVAFTPYGGYTTFAGSGATINYRNLAFTPSNPNGGGTLAAY